jgi:hypothetical protein
LPIHREARAERRDPRRDVRALAARRQRDLRRRVGAARDVATDAHHDVEHEVTERDDLHGLRSSHGDDGESREVAAATRTATRSFVLGGLVGASAVAAGAAPRQPAAQAARAGRARRLRERAVLPRVARVGSEGRPVAPAHARGANDRLQVDVGVADPERCPTSSARAPS